MFWFDDIHFSESQATDPAFLTTDTEDFFSTKFWANCNLSQHNSADSDENNLLFSSAQCCIHCPGLWWLIYPAIRMVYWLKRMRLVTQRNVIKDSCANNDNQIHGVSRTVTTADNHARLWRLSCETPGRLTIEVTRMPKTHARSRRKFTVMCRIVRHQQLMKSWKTETFN